MENTLLGEKEQKHEEKIEKPKKKSKPPKNPLPHNPLYQPEQYWLCPFCMKIQNAVVYHPVRICKNGKTVYFSCQTTKSHFFCGIPELISEITEPKEKIGKHAFITG